MLLQMRAEGEADACTTAAVIPNLHVGGDNILKYIKRRVKACRTTASIVTKDYDLLLLRTSLLSS